MHTNNNSIFLSSFGACKYKSYWGSLKIIFSVDVELVTGAIYVILSSKATLIGAQRSFFEVLEKCCLMCEPALN